jgi:hypothetical protein
MFDERVKFSLLVRPDFFVDAQNKTDRILRLFIFILFNSRDDAIHPQGICGLGNIKETSPGLWPVYYHNRNPSPSAVRCAQIPGYEPPIQKSEGNEKYR